MADCTEDSEDATSSIGDEERVRRLFQACDGNGDGFIDSQDLMNICRELNLEDSIEKLMRELGADEQGRISYQEFFKRRLALRPEIEAIKSNRPQQPEYLPTSSENSLGEGKMSWEFDSGARDLSPEPNSLQQLVASAPHPASGNLLDLANKLHVAALASLKSEILDLSNKLQCATYERNLFENFLQKAESEKLKVEQKLKEESQLHEEQLTELHSVIAELTRKVQHQRTLVIREEEDVSETDENEVSAVVECSQTIPLDEEIYEDPTAASSTSSNDNEEVEEGAEKAQDDSSDLREQLAQVKADNAMLQERLNRALNDLETISKLNSKKQIREVPNNLEVVRVARVSSPSRVIDRTSPSLVTQKVTSPSRNSPNRIDIPIPKIAERVRLKKMDSQVTGSDIATFGVCHTKVAEHLVSDMQEESDLQELSRGDVVSQKQFELETERLTSKLEHVRAQNTVLALTLEECKAQCDRLFLLVGKYESNAIALKLALNCSDQALQISEALVCLLETELSLVLSNCRGSSSAHSSAECEDNRFLRRASENRKKAERHAKEVLDGLEGCHEGGSHSEWNPSNEMKLRDHLNRLKSERSTIKSTVVELESPHVQPVTHNLSLAEAQKLDLETAVLMQELMSMREDKAELKARIHFLEKERSAQELRAAAQNPHLQALLQSIHHLQAQINEGKEDPDQANSYHKGDLRLKERMEELVGTLDKVTKNSELRYQQNEELVLDLRAANTALVSTLDRCKKKYQGRLKKLETQMMSLVERHAQQVSKLKQRIGFLEEQNQCHGHCQREQ